MNPSPAGFAAALLAVLLAGPSPASAHPGSWGMRVDQELTVRIETDAIQIVYVTQLNRQAAYFLEVLRMDGDGDGQLSAEEQAAYFRELAQSLPAGLEVSVNGRDVALRQVGGMELSAPTPDQLRKQFRYEISPPPNWEQGASVELHNENYLDYPGSITLAVEPGPGVDLVYDSRNDMPDPSPGVDDLSMGPQQRDLTFRFCRGTGRELTNESTESGPSETGQEVTSDGAAASDPGPWFALAVSALLVGILLAVGAALRGVFRRTAAIVCGLSFLLSAGLASWGYVAAHGLRSPSSRPLEREAAVQIFQQLHRRIYHAFDANSESAIYDTLADSLGGRMLEEVYYEVYDALRQQQLGATRFRIRRVKPLATEVVAVANGTKEFHVRYRWRVYGTVSHYGHTHARFNEYEAVYRVQYCDSRWKITDSQARQNRRVTLTTDGRAA